MYFHPYLFHGVIVELLSSTFLNFVDGPEGASSDELKDEVVLDDVRRRLVDVQLLDVALQFSQLVTLAEKYRDSPVQLYL